MYSFRTHRGLRIVGWREDFMYDEWFKVDKIVRSANGNAQKVKHRKKVKSKTEREKAKTEKLTGREDTSPSWNHSVLGFSKAGVAHNGFPQMEGCGGSPPPQLPVKYFFSGLPATEGSSNNERESDMDTGSSSMAFDAIVFSSNNSSSSSSSCSSCSSVALCSSSHLETEQVTKANLENMSSTERIAFLQKKLKEIRSHYLSLKSEVASIDRRRKLMKKRGRSRLIHNINKK